MARCSISTCNLPLQPGQYAVTAVGKNGILQAATHFMCLFNNLLLVSSQSPRSLRKALRHRYKAEGKAQRKEIRAARKTAQRDSALRVAAGSPR